MGKKQEDYYVLVEITKELYLKSFQKHLELTGPEIEVLLKIVIYFLR